MRFNTKRIMSIALATMITIGGTSVYAANFKDTSNHWAKTYIEKGRDLGLLNGFPDGTFKPQDNVSRIQTISLAARVLNLPQSEIIKAENKYKSTLLENGVPEWAIGNFSVALSEGIIDTSILNKLYSDNGAEALNSREEVTIYLARAMGLQKEVESKGSNIILPFNDKDKVTESAKAYVLVMNEIGIISGDNVGNFNPKSPITRAEMSKVLSMSHDYIENNKKKDDEVTTVVGTIYDKFSAGGRNYIVIEDILSSRKTYEVDSESVLKIDGKTVSYNDLNTGIKASAEVKGNEQNQIGVIKSLSSENTVEKYTGTVYEFNDFAKTLTIEYQEGGIKNRKVLSLAFDVDIRLDGKKASLSDLRKGDNLKVEVTNGKITEIDAEANTRDIEGVLKEINISDKYISVEDKDGNKEKYYLHKDVKITRDRRRVDLDGLRKGDEVKIHVEDKLVLEIDAKIVETEVEGTIKGKNISYDKSEITILNNKTKKEETYLIPRDASIELDGKRARLDQLELGHYVEITLEGEEVVEIEGQSTTINNKHLGRVSYVGGSYLEVILDNGETIDVILEDTLIKDEVGKVISIRLLSKGDGVLITGDMYQGEIIATEIMRLTK